MYKLESEYSLKEMTGVPYCQCPDVDKNASFRQFYSVDYWFLKAYLAYSIPMALQRFVIGRALLRKYLASIVLQLSQSYSRN